jgi:hypothetical protein
LTASLDLGRFDLMGTKGNKINYEMAPMAELLVEQGSDLCGSGFAGGGLVAKGERAEQCAQEREHEDHAVVGEEAGWFHKRSSIAGTGG